LLPAVCVALVALLAVLASRSRAAADNVRQLIGALPALSSGGRRVARAAVR